MKVASVVVLGFLAAVGNAAGTCAPGSGAGGGDGGVDAAGNLDASMDAAVPGGSLPAFERALGEGSFSFASGAFQALDTSQCCNAGASCEDSNPLSPYFAFYLPAGAGQTAQNPDPPALGTAPTNVATPAWRLREDEAVVYLGTTPPSAKYFGFTPYLYDRQVGASRKLLFASLEATTNNLVVRTNGGDPFEQPIVVIATADQNTDRRVRAALTTSGFSPSTFNTVVLDGATAHLGLDAAADTLGVVFRVADFADARAGQAWLSSSHGALLRVTPSTAGAPSLLAPTRRTPSTSTSELALTPSVDALEAALKAANPSKTATPVDVSMTLSPAPGAAPYDFLPDPANCVATATNCAGDNRDTNYPFTGLAPWLPDATSFYIVYGVDHAATGKTAYSSVSVLEIDHLIGVGGVSSSQYGGSAKPYLPSDPNAGKLYAWKIARSCAPGESSCTAIPEGACPGIAPGKLSLLQFRTYLDPATKTRPDWNTLVPDRVLLFR